MDELKLNINLIDTNYENFIKTLGEIVNDCAHLIQDNNPDNSVGDEKGDL